MNKSKKFSIGYNTVPSINGVISTRGVKSKPDSVQIFGYTHEIGDGEKSPNNIYQLIGLDSGNVNLYDADNLTNIQVTNDGRIRKGIILESSDFKSKNCCIYFDLNESTGISKTSIGINIKFLYKNGQYEVFKPTNFIAYPRKIEITDTVEKILIYEAGQGANGGYFDLYKNLTILDTSILPTKTITEEHSITLINNNTTIKIPVSVVLHSVNNISDTLIKKNNVWGIIKKNSVFSSNEYIDSLKINSTKNDGTIVYQMHHGNPTMVCNENNNIYVCKSNMLNMVQISVNKNNIAKLFCDKQTKIMFIRYSQSEYPQFSSVETLRKFLLENPVEIIYPDSTENFIELSDYAQELLNSFVLENKNNILVEGNPDIEISGYLKKGAT